MRAAVKVLIDIVDLAFEMAHASSQTSARVPKQSFEPHAERIASSDKILSIIGKGQGDPSACENVKGFEPQLPTL